MTHRILEDHPKHSEVYSMSDYEVKERTPSAFLAGKYVKKAIGFNCPSCEKLNPIIDHGESCECSCGLKCQLWGNGLHIWGKPKENKKTTVWERFYKK